MKTVILLFTLIALVSCASHHGDKVRPHEDSQCYENGTMSK